MRTFDPARSWQGFWREGSWALSPPLRGPTNGEFDRAPSGLRPPGRPSVPRPGHLDVLEPRPGRERTARHAGEGPRSWETGSGPIRDHGHPERRRNAHSARHEADPGGRRRRGRGSHRGHDHPPPQTEVESSPVGVVRSAEGPSESGGGVPGTGRLPSASLGRVRRVGKPAGNSCAPRRSSDRGPRSESERTPAIVRRRPTGRTGTRPKRPRARRPRCRRTPAVGPP